MNYQDYICGTKFRDIADCIIGKDTVKWVKPEGRAKECPILYSATHDAAYLFEYAGRDNGPCILLTHNSDGGVKNSQKGPIGPNDADSSLLPSNVIKWYAQNVEDDYYDTKIVPIPIGLENRYCFDYDKAEMLFNEAKRPVERKKAVYVNFNIETNRTERMAALSACEKAGKACTIRMGRNGEDYQRYLEELHSHEAVACPRGNGLDCHRTWEALYLGVLPIMLFNFSLYTFNLPIAFIDSWGELSEAELNYVNYSKNALSMKYWEERILNAK